MQYIDTGIIFRYGYRYQTRHLWVNRYSGEDKILGGGSASAGLYYNLAFPRFSGVLAIWVADEDYALKGSPDRSIMYGLWYDADVLLTENGYASMTDIVSKDRYETPIQVPTDFYTSNHIWLFRDSYTTYVNPSCSELASYRAWDASGQLLQDFRPVRRLSDGAIGMYDTVSKTFFGNQGSGNFVAGEKTGVYY